jgi:hypothetical protein
MIFQCETGDHVEVEVEGESVAGARLSGLNLHRALLDEQELAVIAMHRSSGRPVHVDCD